MNKKIFIVEGYLASGKSTFTTLLSSSINVPYLIKDTFKIALCESAPVKNKDDSNLFSAVTFNAIMYATERLMEVGYPVIIEGNFVPEGMKKVNEAGVIKQLIDKYGYQSLTYKFTGDTQILYHRYIERNKLPERGDANRDFEEISFETYDYYCHSLDNFSVGGDVIKIDTTDFDKVDFSVHIDSALHFMK